jgi:mRNA interferase RelE/StbE
MYEILYHPEVLEDLARLDNSIKIVFQKKLAKRQANPFIPGAALSGDLAGTFKIKDSKSGYRLIYAVDAEKLEILVLAIDKREGLKVYRSASRRFTS